MGNWSLMKRKLLGVVLSELIDRPQIQPKTKSLVHGQKRRVRRRTKTGNRNLLVVVEKSIRCVDQWNRKQDRTTTPHDGILERKIG
jgi:hypothetical protein